MLAEITSCMSTIIRAPFDASSLGFAAQTFASFSDSGCMMNTSPPGLLADVSHHIEPLIRHLPKIFRDQPALWTSTTLLGLSALWLRKNYREFKAIGRGGLPYNVRGWLIALFLKLFSRETLSTLEYDRDPNKERWIEDADSIPVRKSSRPGSGFHVVPARQTNQLPTKEMMVVSNVSYLACTLSLASRLQLLDRFFAHLVKQNSDYLEFQRSPHETLHDGVVLKSTLPAPHDVAKRAIREVAHIHPLDHSMHVLLAPQDCKFGESIRLTQPCVS